MGKKKKLTLAPPIRGDAIAWHVPKGDGAVGIEYVGNALNKGLDKDRLMVWMGVPGDVGVRTPIAWYRVWKDGKVADIDYEEVPAIDDGSTTGEEDLASVHSDEVGVAKEGDEGPSPAPAGGNVLAALAADMGEALLSSEKGIDGGNFIRNENVMMCGPNVGVAEYEAPSFVATPQAAPPKDAEPRSIQVELCASAPTVRTFANVVKSALVGPHPRPFMGAAQPKKSFMNAGLGGKLVFSPPTSCHVDIKVAEALPMESVWGWALLGQYVGPQPGHFLIMEMIRSWGIKANYRREGGWMIFNFLSEVDRDKVLLGGPYFIRGKPLMLKNIPDKFSFNRRDIASIPLWVRIIGLSKNFWTPEVLGRVASHVGKPLFMDPVTDSRKRGSYARVLVEVNLADPVKREVSLHSDDGDVHDCSFLFENEPKYCRECCSFGHLEDGCSFKERKEPVGGKSSRPKPARNDDKPIDNVHEKVEMDPAPSRVSYPSSTRFVEKDARIDGSKNVPASDVAPSTCPDPTRSPGMDVGTSSPTMDVRNIDDNKQAAHDIGSLGSTDEEGNMEDFESDGRSMDNEEVFPSSSSMKIKCKSKEKMDAYGGRDGVLGLQAPNKWPPLSKTNRCKSKNGQQSS